jgi:amino acid transporter
MVRMLRSARSPSLVFEASRQFDKRKGRNWRFCEGPWEQVEAFGFSISIIAPTLAMAFTTPLTAQSAGRAAPLAYLIGGIIVTLVGLSFIAFGRRVAHAGSVYAYVRSALGARFGFVAAWALLLMYVTLFAGSTALVGNFGAAALDHAKIEGPHLWFVVAVLT